MITKVREWFHKNDTFKDFEAIVTKISRDLRVPLSERYRGRGRYILWNYNISEIVQNLIADEEIETEIDGIDSSVIVFTYNKEKHKKWIENIKQ